MKKLKLVRKKEGWYNLNDGMICIGSTYPELQGYKLSKENCDTIFDKDKVFTEEDMRRAYFDGYNDKEENKYFNPGKSIQELTEIEVEVIMRNSRTGNIVKHDSDLEWDEDGLCDRAIPKLDSNGCLVLKKVL